MSKGVEVGDEVRLQRIDFPSAFAIGIVEQVLPAKSQFWIEHEAYNLEGHSDAYSVNAWKVEITKKAAKPIHVGDEITWDRLMDLPESSVLRVTFDDSTSEYRFVGENALISPQGSMFSFLAYDVATITVEYIPSEAEDQT